MVYHESERLDKTLDFVKMAESLKSKLINEINAHKCCQGRDGTMRQLNQINHDIEQMLISKNYTPSYPRTIIDSWDFNSKLGKQLLEFYEVYKKGNNSLL